MCRIPDVARWQHQANDAGSRGGAEETRAQSSMAGGEVQHCRQPLTRPNDVTLHVAFHLHTSHTPKAPLSLLYVYRCSRCATLVSLP